MPKSLVPLTRKYTAHPKFMAAAPSSKVDCMWLVENKWRLIFHMNTSTGKEEVVEVIADEAQLQQIANAALEAIDLIRDRMNHEN
jgi:hypothetical protein